MMSAGVVAETLLLDALSKALSFEIVGGAERTTVGFQELELTILVSFFEGEFSTVVMGFEGKDVNSIAFAFFAFICTFVHFLWWLFFTEALGIEDINLHSLFIACWFTSNFLTDMFMLNQESRCLIPSG